MGFIGQPTSQLRTPGSVQAVNPYTVDTVESRRTGTGKNWGHRGRPFHSEQPRALRLKFMLNSKCVWDGGEGRRDG